MIFQTLLFYILLNIIMNNVMISGETTFRKDYIYNEQFSSFYKLHRVLNSWGQAKVICQQEGALLFYPETKDESMYVSNAFYTQYNKGWIGISDLLVTKQFETVTGVSAESVYCNWEANLWYENNNDKHCVILNSMRNMENINCDTDLPFVCKKTLNSIVWNDNCNIADSKYVYNRDFEKCYKFHLRPLDWKTAHSTCIAEQSYLAIINSQEEADFLVNMTTEAPKIRHRSLHLVDAVHLGYHQLFRDGYTTVKGYPLLESGYTKWSYNETYTSSEQLCGSMFYDGELNDINCDAKRYFICEHDIETTELSKSDEVSPILDKTRPFWDRKRRNES